VAGAIGAVAALGGAAAALWAGVVAARWAVLLGRGAAFVLRVATLKAYRRCPDCRSIRRAEARICARCGTRLT
jgi:hypothetical protein